MQIYLALAIPILLATAWLYTAQASRSSFPSLKGKRICLLIAHPDDEAMFFSPTVLALTAPEAGNHVKILCLSSGNADGLGSTRKSELSASALLLGLRSPSDVLVIEDPNFPDSMTTTWPAPLIAELLSNAFSPTLNSSSKKASKTPSEPTATIDTLITFDSQGVSAHPNHISLYHGARQWLSALMGCEVLEEEEEGGATEFALC
ncbi:N-acetylglucosaminylphosphatidylinositol deacetylase, partial [Lecanoromycetidae sp. Uapishka_2]